MPATSQMERITENWISFHVYYHEDLSRPILALVRPTVSSLLARGWIDSFFFVRFRLGGPHLRLRLSVLPGREESVSEEVRREAQRFLGENPSSRSLDRAQVLAETRAILASDPYESDGSVYPDNTLFAAQFRPEAERYGGSNLLGPSLDFFAFSSVVALEFLVRHAEAARASQLATAYRLLLRQALGFCTSQEELLSFLSYGLENWTTTSPEIIAKGDEVYQAQRQAFQGLFRREVAAMGGDGPSHGLGAGASALLGEASHGLSQAIGGAAAERRSIGISQLHMTANRLGLINPEESYLCRLLSCTARDLLCSRAPERLLFQAARARSGGTLAGLSLRDRLARALTTLSEVSP